MSINITMDEINKKVLLQHMEIDLYHAEGAYRTLMKEKTLTILMFLTSTIFFVFAYVDFNLVQIIFSILFGVYLSWDLKIKSNTVKYSIMGIQILKKEINELRSIKA